MQIFTCQQSQYQLLSVISILITTIILTDALRGGETDFVQGMFCFEACFVCDKSLIIYIEVISRSKEVMWPGHLTNK